MLSLKASLELKSDFDIYELWNNYEMSPFIYHNHLSTSLTCFHIHWEIISKFLWPLRAQMTLNWHVNLDHVKSMFPKLGSSFFSQGDFPKLNEDIFYMANRLLAQTSFMWLLKKAYKLHHHKPFSFQVCNWSVINIRLDHLLFIIQMSLSSSENQMIFKKGCSAPCWSTLQIEFLEGGSLGMKYFDAEIPCS